MIKFNSWPPEPGDIELTPAATSMLTGPETTTFDEAKVLMGRMAFDILAENMQISDAMERGDTAYQAARGLIEGYEGMNSIAFLRGLMQAQDDFRFRVDRLAGQVEEPTR